MTLGIGSDRHKQTVVPDQMPQKVPSDKGIQCLQFIYQLLLFFFFFFQTFQLEI